MENIDKIINIRVKYSDLIKGMSESAKRIDTLNDRISELKSGLKGLKAARKAGTIDKEAYNEQVAQTTQELVANREEVKALNRRCDYTRTRFRTISKRRRISKVR